MIGLWRRMVSYKWYHVDLILRDIKRVEQIIKDTEQGIVTAIIRLGIPMVI